jgi:ubiquinone/menaquinone biosynthesis C-methylase UbiE
MAKDRSERWRRGWDRQARRYDRQMEFWDRHLFKDSRAWVCRQARGSVLEVAVGSGMNFPHYSRDIGLLGIDFSPEMLALARKRASDLARDIELRVGDAHDLDVPDASVDTVVCTFSLCAIPDEVRALQEMHRVLKPGGLLLLADHICATTSLARGAQRTMELVTVPLSGEHFRRRPSKQLPALGFVIHRRERFGPVGLVERLTASKPT